MHRAGRYFPRDFFFCFFTFTLTIGAFVSVPMETELDAPCFFDFLAIPILLDRGRDPTLQTVTPASLQRGVGWLDWPCGQNAGRNPDGRQRASSARDDGASANRVHVAGPVLLPEERRRCWDSLSDEREQTAAKVVR